MAEEVTWPCPESIGEGTTQGKRRGGHQWDNLPQNTSQDVCPTDCLSQMTASSCVPSTYPASRSSNPAGGSGERCLSQKRRSKNFLLSHQKFTFCDSTYVASISRGTQQGPHFENKPTPCHLSTVVSVFGGDTFVSDWNRDILAHMNQSPTVCDLVCSTQFYRFRPSPC